MFSSVLAYLLFFRLISSVGATKTATVSYLIPLFSTLRGVVVLREQVGWATLARMVVILGGVVLATGTRATLQGHVPRRGSAPRAWRLDRAASSPSDELE